MKIDKKLNEDIIKKSNHSTASMKDPNIEENIIACYNDSDNYGDNDEAQIYFDDACYEITTWMEKNNQYDFFCWINDFGWRSQYGHKLFHVRNGLEFIGAVLPNTPCNWYVYNHTKDDKEYFLRMRVYHHDSPTGETYYFRKPTEEEENEDS